MAQHKGNGGEVFFGAGAGTSLAVSKYTLDKDVKLANKTHSKSNGRKLRHPTVGDDQFVLEIPWDDTINPQTIGCKEGTDGVKVSLKIGDSANSWTCAGCIIEKVRYINDEDEDIVRLELTGYANDTIGFVYT